MMSHINYEGFPIAKPKSVAQKENCISFYQAGAQATTKVARTALRLINTEVCFLHSDKAIQSVLQVICHSLSIVPETVNETRYS